MKTIKDLKLKFGMSGKLLVKERYKCPHCGEPFRLAATLFFHEKYCKWKDFPKKEQATVVEEHKEEHQYIQDD